MRLKIRLLLVVASLGMTTAAYAVPVTGQVSFNGYAEALGSAGFGSATGIAFADRSGTGVSGAITSYGAATGAFVALGTCIGGSCGTIKDIASFTANAPISGFVTLNTGSLIAVSFDLNSITNLSPNTANESILLKAVGTINFTGYDATYGSFYLTVQGDNLTSFSATILVLPRSIAEPASLTTLGGTLAMLGLLRRRKA